MMDYPPHPAAELFPLLEGDELQALADDIREHGLNQGITLHGGMILDGRNRAAACEIAGVEPRYVEWFGASPVSFAVSQNLHRRDLTPSQRATVAVKMLPLLEQEAKERQREHGQTAPGRPSNTSGEPAGSVSPPGESRHIAAQAVGVGSRIVSDAKLLSKRDPDAFERVRAGELTVNAALREAGRHTQEPAASVQAPSGRQLILAEAARNRLHLALAQIDGMLVGLDDRTHVERASVACGNTELGELAALAGRCASRLRTMKTRIEEVQHGR